MSKFPLLFQAGVIGRMHLRNRIIMAPLGTNLADASGAVTRQPIDWYVERARGGVGLVIVENASADGRFGRGLARQLRIDDPKLTPGLNELVEGVQAAGAKIAIQINIQGAGVDMELQPGVQPVGPSPISYVFAGAGSENALPARMWRVKQLRGLRREEMKELRDSFLRASGIAKSAGFDAIEIHGAHMIPPFKRDLGGFLACLKGQVEKKVEVELPREAHAEDLLNQNFDSVIVATGSSPRSQARYPEAKGVDCWDVLPGKAKLDGNRVVVLGKGRVACETSEFMARRRKKEVTIIHSGPPEELANDMEPIFERRLLLERLRDCGVVILNGTSVIEITPEGVQARGQTSGWIPCDHVVQEEAPVPDRSLLEELHGKMETIAVGDCLAPGDIYQAIHDGFRAGYRIE